MKNRKPEHSLSDELITHPGLLKVHASLAILTKDIGEILTKKFPGWAWAVRPDQTGMVIDVMNLHLHDEWAYTIRTAEIHNDPRRRLAEVAGREILQRSGFEARGLKGQEHALKVAKRDGKGRVIPIHVWDRLTRQQREAKRVEEAAANLRSYVDGLILQS